MHILSFDGDRVCLNFEILKREEKKTTSELETVCVCGVSMSARYLVPADLALVVMN